MSERPYGIGQVIRLAKERPIIMSGNHPQLILSGDKTMTRRTWGLEEINKAPRSWIYFWNSLCRQHEFYDKYYGDAWLIVAKCPYGQVGDGLWVKETWSIGAYRHKQSAEIIYKAGDLSQHITVPWNEWLEAHTKYGGSAGDWDKWRSPRFMPRWASRILLEITSLRAERLQEITEEDAIREGIRHPEHAFRMIAGGDVEVELSPKEQFAELWDSLNAKRGYGWDKNPWVWVIGFKMLG